MRLMLFFDGRNAKRAWPVVREYIRPNVKPKKSNSPSGTLQICVLSSFTVSFIGLLPYCSLDAPKVTFGQSPRKIAKRTARLPSRRGGRLSQTVPSAEKSRNRLL